MSTVTACLITKNEAVHLADCLASLSGHVYEIVLVDTGSDDKTVAIANRFGCKVSHLPWRQDFAEARNHGLDRATADWILYIDADERLSCANGGTLKNLLPGPNAAAAVRFFPRLDTTAYAEYRLFRRAPRIRFTGSMHETMLRGIWRVCAEDRSVIEERFDVVITHHGYEGDQSAKHARNLPMLEKAIEADPNRVYLRYHLGVTLLEMGRRDEAALSLLAGLALASEPAPSEQVRVEGSLCARMLSEIRLREDDPDEALETTDRGLALYANNLALQLMKARCLLMLGREQEAADTATRLLEHDPETLFDPHVAYQKNLFRLDCSALLGNIHFRAKNYEKAAEFFEAAAQAAPDSLEFKTKGRLARARADATPLGISAYSCSN